MEIVVKTTYTVECMKRFYKLQLRGARMVLSVIALMGSGIVGTLLGALRAKAMSIEPEDESVLLFECITIPVLCFVLPVVMLRPRRKKEFDNRRITMTFSEQEVFVEFDAVTKATFYYSGFFKVVCEDDVVYFVGTEQPVVVDLSTLSQTDRQAILQIVQNCNRFH